MTTDNAIIGAPLISVCSLSAGQVIDVNVDIGDRVSSDRALPKLGRPGFRIAGPGRDLVQPRAAGQPVEAPISGYVAAVWTYPGAIIRRRFTDRYPV